MYTVVVLATVICGGEQALARSSGGPFRVPLREPQGGSQCINSTQKHRSGYSLQIVHLFLLHPSLQRHLVVKRYRFGFPVSMHTLINVGEDQQDGQSPIHSSRIFELSDKKRATIIPRTLGMLRSCNTASTFLT
jgi:hypothetical protein